jgi:hypothetical protein
MSDSALVVAFNEAGVEHHPAVGGAREHFLFLVGRAGGGLRGGGRYLSLGGRTIGDAYLSVANAMGVDVASFGAGPTGPIAGL